MKTKTLTARANDFVDRAYCNIEQGASWRVWVRRAFEAGYRYGRKAERESHRYPQPPKARR